MFNASKSRSKVRSFSHALAIVSIHLFPLALLVLRVLGAIAQKVNVSNHTTMSFAAHIDGILPDDVDTVLSPHRLQVRCISHLPTHSTGKLLLMPTSPTAENKANSTSLISYLAAVTQPLHR